MPRHADQILLDRLLTRAAVAKIPLKDLLTPKQIAELDEIKKQISVETKEDKISGLDSILQVLKDKILTPDVAAKAQANFLKEGALSQTEALKIIYPQDPKLVVPVIIKTLEALLERVQRRSVPSKPTIEFLEAALKKVKEVDEKQNWAQARQITLIMELTKKQIRADMQPLINGIEKVTIPEEEALFWFEAMLWIEGHFLRQHTQALAKGNGQLQFIPEDAEVVVPLDEEDEKLCYGKGVPIWTGNKVTKHFVNSHFHALAVLFERKIKRELKLFFTTTDVFPTAIVKDSKILDVERSSQSPSLSTSRTSPLSVVPVTGTNDSFPYNTIAGPDGRLQLTTFIPAECPKERVAEAMRLFTRSIKGEALQLSQAPREQLIDRLKRIKKHSSYELMSLMEDAFRDCTVTERENKIMHSYAGIMKRYVDDHYTNSKTAASGLWPAMPLKDRQFKANVDKLFETINEPDAVGQQKSALEIITLLKNTWLNVNGKLRVVMENLMVNICNHFIANLDESLDEKHISHMSRSVGKK